MKNINIKYFLKYCNKNIKCYIFAFIIIVLLFNYYLSYRNLPKLTLVMKEIPIPENSRLLSTKSMLSPRSAILIKKYETEKPPKHVYDFYTPRLYKEGWGVGGDTPAPVNHINVIYSKNWSGREKGYLQLTITTSSEYNGQTIFYLRGMKE